MAVELVVPSVGESVTEVEIGDWLKNEGEFVDQDEPVVVLETDKVTVELPAPASGTIKSLLKHKGDKATVGDVIGYLEEGNGARPAKPAAAIERPAPEQPIAKPEAVHVEPAPAGRNEEVVPMTPIRRRIAERLVEAQKSAALLTTFNQVDMSEVIALRKKHQETF